MDTRYLLPHQFKIWGWLLAIPCFILGVIWLFDEFTPGFLEVPVISLFEKPLVLGNVKVGNGDSFKWVSIEENNIADELIALGLLSGLLLLTFTRHREEDEMIMKVRLESLLWSTLANSLLLAFALIFLYDVNFFFFMVFSMYSLLLLFVVRFHWQLNKLRKIEE